MPSLGSLPECEQIGNAPDAHASPDGSVPERCSHAPGFMPGQPSLGNTPEYEKIGIAP